MNSVVSYYNIIKKIGRYMTYKVKRFSNLESVIESMPVTLSKTSNGFGFFSHKSDSKLEILNSTVRSSLRLQSYIRSLDLGRLNKSISECRIKSSNGTEIKGSDLVEKVESKVKKGDAGFTFLIINPSSNPLLLVKFHKSWLGILDLSLKSISYSPDYFTSECGDDLYVFSMTIDDYDELAFFLSVFSYYKNIYANDSKKVRVEILD